MQGANSSFRTTAASFWHGDPLSFMEIMGLQSFVQQGYQVTLFSYDPVENVPAGVECRDASEILPRDRIFWNREWGSFAPFADYFRYHLLQKTNHFWIDTDAVALRPLTIQSDYLFAWHHKIIAIGILGLPADGPVLDRLIAACENPNADMPWLWPPQQLAMQQLKRQKGFLEPGDLPYKALGPMALTWLLKSGEDRHALPTKTYYPLEPREILRKARRFLHKIPPEAESVHLYSSLVKLRMIQQGWSIPPPGTVLDALCKRQGIDARQFPLCQSEPAT